MRCMGKKAAKRAREVQAFRDQLRRSVLHCECCGRHVTRVRYRQFDVHEILCGGLRQKVLDEPCALLVICRDCHEGPVFGGHSGSDRAAFQLAQLLRSRPDDYDLERFNWLRNPNAPRFVEQEQVDAFIHTNLAKKSLDK